jgi:heme exporter protein D|tara:strand:- start:4198 stop:4431 length:234 start_codon:yes stop_codon:yes gene_type:complete
MMSEIILMNGYGPYVWSAFSFTLISFVTLILITRKQLSNEKKKFASRIGFLSDEKLQVAKLQNTNKEILDIALKSKV